MRNRRRNTLVLVLASVIAFAGSCAADNYKNTLVGIKFEQAPSGISMVLQTKANYTATVTPRKMDSETYVLILPEVDCTDQTPSLAEVSNSIKSVNIRTMPYSDNNKGYTKVTVKTYGNTNLLTRSMVAVPDPDKRQAEQSGNKVANDEAIREAELQRQAEIEQRRQEAAEKAREQVKQATAVKPVESRPVQEQKPQTQRVLNARESVDVKNNTVNNYNPPADNSSRNRMIILGVLLAIAIPTYFLLRGNENMANAAGERINIDIDEETKKKKNPDKDKKDKKDKKDIKSTIKKLDSKYSGFKMPPMRSFSGSNEPVSTVKPSEELNIVDLDAIFQEHSKSQGSELTEEENDALEDFLKGFSFDEDMLIAKENEESAGYDEEYYEKIISDKDVKFSSQDIECIKDLLNSEINGDTLKNIEQYAVSNPIQNKKPSKQSVLENLVSDYAIKQDILFSKDDIAILKKLMNVELDSNFVTDLRTNPEKTVQMEKEIVKSEGRRYKPSEIVTLKVKDFLPNLSDELKAHGNKQIVSDYKPETVYYKEGYEVSKLAVSNLPDLSKAVHDEKEYIPQPSAAYQITDDSYEVSTLNISNELPDLKDVLAHPEKYQEEEKEVFVADEGSLLNNLANVTFKPFDEGKDDFEILNKPEDFTAPTVDDIRDEFSEFENFVVQDDDAEEKVENKKYYDEILNEDAFIDLDSTKKNLTDKQAVPDRTEVIPQISEEKEITEDEPKPEPKLDVPKIAEPKINEPKITPQIRDKKPVREIKREEFVPQKLERVVPRVKRDRISNKSDELLKRIEESRAEREAKKLELKLQNKVPATKKYKSEHRVQMLDSVSRCIIEGINYEILNSAVLEKDCGCYLAKSKNGFAVIGYRGEDYCILKKYETLKTTVIAARLSEKLEDGTLRFFIRVGLNKFIADLKEGSNIRYVMDL